MGSRVWLGAALVLAACSRAAPTVDVPTGFPLNGGFEQGLEAWGTGYIEDSVRKYHPPEEGMLPLWVSPSAKATHAQLVLDRVNPHGGTTAARLDHLTGKRDQHYSTLAQRVPVKPKTTYEIRLWTRAAAPQGDWFLTAMREWEPHLNLPLTPAWTRSTWAFETMAGEYTRELRFVFQAPGRYWIDDVELVERR